MLIKRKNKRGEIVFIKNTYLEFDKKEDYKRLKEYCVKNDLFVKDFVTTCVTKTMELLNIKR